MEENRSVWKVVLVVFFNSLFFTCSMYQVYVFLNTHPKRVEWWAYNIPPFALPLMILFPFAIGYWCYLLARNLTDFLIGQGMPANLEGPVIRYFCRNGEVNAMKRTDPE